MHRFSVLFLLPMAMCVMDERDNNGIEYYGTSNVHYQKKTLPPTDTFPMSPSRITGSTSKAFVELTTKPARPDNEIPDIPVRTNISVISTQANIQSSPGPLYIGRKRPFILPRRFPSNLKPAALIPQPPLIFRPTLLTDPQSSVILESPPSNISDSQSSIVSASNQSIPLISKFEVNTTIKEPTVERSMAPANNTPTSAADIAVMFQLQEFQSKQPKQEPDYFRSKLNVIINPESTSEIQSETNYQPQTDPTINPLELKSQVRLSPLLKSVWAKEANTTVPLSLDKPKLNTEPAIDPLIDATPQAPASGAYLSFIDAVTQSPTTTTPQTENIQSLQSAVVTTSNQLLVSAVDTGVVSEPDVITQLKKNPQLYLSNDFQSSKTETHMSAAAFHQSNDPSIIELPDTQSQDFILFSPKVPMISKIPIPPTTESNFYELEREISTKSKSTLRSEPEFINQLQSELTYQQKPKLSSQSKPELMLQQGLEPVLQPKEELSHQPINQSSKYAFPKLELVSHREIEFTTQSELESLHQQGKELVAPPEQGLGSSQKHILNSQLESVPTSQQETKLKPQVKSAPALLIKSNILTGNQSSHTQNLLPQPAFVSVSDIVTEKRDNNGIEYYGTSNVRYQKIYPRPILISPITIDAPPELSAAANVSIVSSQLKIPTSPGSSYVSYRNHPLQPTFATQTQSPLVAEPQSTTVSESQPSIVPKSQPLIESRMLTTMPGPSIQLILDSQTHINTSFQTSTLKSPIAPKTITRTFAAFSALDEYTNDALDVPLPQVLQRSMQSQMEPGSLKTNPTLILNEKHNSKLQVEPTSQLQTEPTVQEELRQNALPQKEQIRKAETESALESKPHLSASGYLQKIKPQPIFSPILDQVSLKETDATLSYKSTKSEETAYEATVNVSPHVSVASQSPEANTSQLASNPLTVGAEEVFSVPREIIQLKSSPKLSSRGDFQSSITEIDSTPIPAIHNTTISSTVQLSVISNPQSPGVLFSIPELSNSSKVSIPPTNEPILDELVHENREKIEFGSELEQKQNSSPGQETTYEQGLHPISRSLLESMSRQQQTLTLHPNLEQISQQDLELGLITQELNSEPDTEPAFQSIPDLPSVEHFSDALNLDPQLTIKTDPKSDTQLGVVEETDITMQPGLQKSEHRQEPVLIPQPEIKLMSKQKAKLISQSQESLTSQREIEHTSLPQLELTIQKSNFERNQQSTSRLESTSQHEPEMISPGPKTELASRQEQMITSQLNLSLATQQDPQLTSQPEQDSPGPKTELASRQEQMITSQLNLSLATQQDPQLTSQPEQDSAPQSILNSTSEKYSLNFKPQPTVTTLSKIDVQQAAVKDAHVTLPPSLHKSKHLQEAELESQLEQKLRHSKQEPERVTQQKEGLMFQLKQALTSHQNTNLTSEQNPESWSILETELTSQREPELTSQQETALKSQSTASLLKASSPRPVVAVPEIDLKPNGTYQMAEGQDINGMQYDGISNIRYRITQSRPLSSPINISPTSITPASWNSVVAVTPLLKPDQEHSPGNPVSANISVVSSQHYRPSSSEPSYTRRRKPFVLPNRFRLKLTGQSPPRPLVLPLETTSLTESVVLEPLQSNVSLSQSLTSSTLQVGIQQISSPKTLVNKTLGSSNVERPLTSATNTQIFSADRSRQLLSINVSLPLRPEKDSDSFEAKPEIILDPKSNFSTDTKLLFQPLPANSKAPTLAVQIPITTNITHVAVPFQSAEVSVSNAPLVNTIETQVVSVSHVINQPNTIPQLPLNGGSQSSVAEKHIENIATIHEPPIQSSILPLASDKQSDDIVISIQDFSDTSNSSIQHKKDSTLYELENEKSENPNILGKSEQKLTSQLKAESIYQGELELISRTAAELSHHQGSNLLSQLTPELTSRLEETSTSQLNVELTSQRDPKLTSQPLTSKPELELTSQQELEITSKPKAESVSQSILDLPKFEQFSNQLNFKPQFTMTSVPKINLQPKTVIKDADIGVPLAVDISEYEQEVKLNLTSRSETKLMSKEEPEVISQREDILMYHRKPEQTFQPQLELTRPFETQLISRSEQELTSQQNQNFTSQLKPELTSFLEPELPSQSEQRLTFQLKPELTSFLEPELPSQSEQRLTFQLERELHSQSEAAVAPSSKPNALKPSTQLTLFAFPQMDLKPTDIYEATERQDIKEMEYNGTTYAQYQKTYPRPLPQSISISPTTITSASLKSVVPTAPPARSDYDVGSEIPAAPYVSVVASGFNKSSSPGPKYIGRRRPFVLTRRFRLKPTGQTPQQPLISAVETTSFTRTQLPLIPEPQLLSGSTILNSLSVKESNITVTSRLNVSKTNQESKFVALVPVTPQISTAAIDLSSVDNATQLRITTDTQTPVVASFQSVEVNVSNQSLSKAMETQIAPHMILQQNASSQQLLNAELHSLAPLQSSVAATLIVNEATTLKPTAPSVIQLPVASNPQSWEVLISAEDTSKIPKAFQPTVESILHEWKSENFEKPNPIRKLEQELTSTRKVDISKLIPETEEESAPQSIPDEPFSSSLNFNPQLTITTVPKINLEPLVVKDANITVLLDLHKSEPRQEPRIISESESRVGTAERLEFISQPEEELMILREIEQTYQPQLGLTPQQSPQLISRLQQYPGYRQSLNLTSQSEPELTHHQDSNFTLKSLPEPGLSFQTERELTPLQESELSSIREAEQVLQTIVNLPSVEQFADPLTVITGSNIDPKPLVVKDTIAAPGLQQSQTIEELETPVTEMHELSLQSRVEINSRPQAVAGLESRASTNQLSVIDTTQLPVTATAQLSTVVTTQSQTISIPHVEQQTAPSLDSDFQSTASPAFQSSLATVSRLSEIIQGPSKTAENVTSYSSNLNPEPVAQQHSDLTPRPVTEMTPQREAEISTKLSSSLVELKSQVNHETVLEPVLQAVDIKTPLTPLPSPNFKPITKLAFRRYIQSTPQHKFTASTQHVTQTLPGTISTATQAKPKSLKLAIACKEKNGYYAVDNECNTFIQCQDNKATKLTCPDGLHFKPGTKYYENPCVQPSEVKCINGTSKQYTRLSRLCPKQYGLFSMNDGDCSKYIMCNIGVPTIMNCPPGLVFNPATQSCDWLANVPQCNNPQVFKDFACPSPPLDEFSIESDTIYKYKHGQDCKLYIACQRGYPRLLSCEAGLAYDETSQSCIRAEYVQDCNNSYTV